jgi:hypothetical protein
MYKTKLCVYNFRVSGEEWLVTVDETECFIPAIGVVSAIVEI